MKKELKQAENAKITVKMAVELWLSGKRLFAKPSTYAKYVHTVRSHILPHLGEMSVAEINTGYLTEYLRMLLQEGRVDSTGGLAPKTVHDIYVIIRSILKLAEETWDTANRVSRVSNLWRRTVYVPILDPASREKLESWLFKNREDKRCLGILLCLYTGMRLGEICALKWENIYLDEGFIRINSTLQRIQNVDAKEGEPRTQVVCSPPKSIASSRDIPLPRFILKLLKSDPLRPDVDYFFLTGSTEFLEPRTYQNHFKQYLSVNEIQPINFHALRHTFATRCIAAGVDIKSLSEILGHSSVQMTLNYYVHPSMDDKRRQIELLDQAG